MDGKLIERQTRTIIRKVALENVLSGVSKDCY